MLADQRWRRYEGSAKKCLKRIEKFLKSQKIKHYREAESGKSYDTIVSLSVYAIDEEGFILSTFSSWERNPNREGAGNIVFQITCSSKPEGVDLKFIKYSNDGNKISRAKKLTEVRIDPSSTNRDFIIKVISIILAKLRDELDTYQLSR